MKSIKYNIEFFLNEKKEFAEWTFLSWSFECKYVIKNIHYEKLVSSKWNFFLNKKFQFTNSKSKIMGKFTSPPFHRNLSYFFWNYFEIKNFVDNIQLNSVKGFFYSY